MLASSLLSIPHEFKRSSDLAFRSHHFTTEMARCNRKVNSNSFYSCTSSLWKSFLVSCFPATYHLQKCKFKWIFLYSWIFFLFLFHSFSLQVIHCVLEALSPFSEWNDWKKKDIRIREGKYQNTKLRWKTERILN